MQLTFDNTSTTQERMAEFVNDYMRTVQEYIDAKIALIRAEYELETWFTIALSEGIIEGRNEKEREGNARLLRSDLYDEVHDCKTRELEMWAKREQHRIYDKAIGRTMMVNGFEEGDPDD